MNPPRHARHSRAVLQATPIAVAVSLLALGAPGAFAQAGSGAPAAQESQTVVVTGIRRAIETAIATKRNADTIVEAITSEDLGKLPEPSVADAMARLPGVAAQRNKNTGKAQSISVRGMSPDFNGSLLNGREVASSGDSRGVDFDLYPAELLTSVLVYKTPHAALMGQGLSSTIDMRTIRPLDSKTRQVAVNYRKQRTGIGNGIENGEGSGDRMSLSYVDQFMNNTLGVALGAVKFTEEGAAQVKVNTWGGWTPTLAYNGAQVGVPGGFGRDLEFSDQERKALMGVLQWKPNKNFETTLDVFQSEGRSANFKKGIEGFIGGNSEPWNYRTSPPTLVNATVANGVATSGTIDNFKGVIRNHNEGTDDELKAWGLNSKLRLDGGWTLTGDLAQSKVSRTGARYETTAGLPGNGNANHRDGIPAVPGATGTISWTGFTGSNHADLVFTSNTDFSDRNVVKLTDVMGWGGGPLTPQAGYVASPKVTDETNNVRVSALRDVNWGPVSRIEAGLNAVQRDKISNTQEGFLVINGGTGPFAGVNVPGSSVATVAGFRIATWDPRDSLGSIYSLRSNTYGAVINRNWKVSEEVTTGFVKADVEGKLFGYNYTGNVGAQVVNTKQSSDAFVNDSGRCTGATPDTCTSRTGGTSFTDVLPSLNLSLELASDTLLRFGLGKTISRPNMGQMRASIDMPSRARTDPDNPASPEILVSSGGNPELEPFRATALDVSFERYFGRNKGAFSVAGFYKDLDTYILTLPQRFDFTSIVPSNFSFPTGGPVGLLNRPTNGSGGSISGIEIAVNFPLSMVSPVLDGFGFFINHSDTKSTLVIRPGQLPGMINTNLEIPLPGLSRKVTNLRFYYEKHGFQAAIASRTRSDFLGEFKDYKDDGQLAFVKGETVVDLQLGYTFPDRTPLKGLSLLFQANNITNTEFQQYENDRNNPTEKKKFGKTYLFGINYKL